ncbi:MAG: metallophosphoesterase [Caldilineae bacterium]|nr:MAG: metallophosphoesterase [Caldilineae bacterium]
MCIALISDIHGNLPALEAVLADVRARRVDRIICLGDAALFGPQPGACLDRLRAVGCPVVMGNTDAWALHPQPHPRRDENSARIEAIERWGAARLTDEQLAYIHSFQPTVRWTLGTGVELLAYHGSPRSFHDPIVAATPDKELDAYFGAETAQVLAGGHTHTQFLRRYRESLLLNPGSVGLPYVVSAQEGRSYHPAYAEYAVVCCRGAAISVEFYQALYALEDLAAAVKSNEMPYADWWLADWMRAGGGSPQGS